ncbi:hypothetical protein BGX31_000737 [Mortierella sp. GBA43]|nr:hypothetical protein BGX31_000737 [Mortierella sp. GBA43]
MSSSAIQRVILLVGPPGSGKSTLAKALVKAVPEYVRINQDDLGDRSACEEMAMSALLSKDRTQSVIIDRCNFDRRQRKVWINMAHQLDVQEVDAIIMDTAFHQCKERVFTRTNHPTQVDGPKGVEILYRFMNMMTLPTYFEGLSRIMRLAPQPTSEYTEESIREILQRLDKIQRPGNPQAYQWTREDYYFNAQNHDGDESRYATPYQQQHKEPRYQVDDEGFTTKKRSFQNGDSSSSNFGPDNGWRSREAAKQPRRQQRQQAVRPSNPFDILGNDSDVDAK